MENCQVRKTKTPLSREQRIHRSNQERKRANWPHRNARRFHPGTVTLAYGEGGLGLHINVKIPAEKIYRIYERLLYQPNRPAGIGNEMLHMHVMRNEGRDGFILQLLRHGYRGAKPRWLLSEYAFRIWKEAPQVAESIGNNSGRELEIIDPADLKGDKAFDEMLKPLTAKRFTSLLTHSSYCIIWLGGSPWAAYPIHIYGMQHQNKWHKVGALCSHDVRAAQAEINNWITNGWFQPPVIIDE